MQNQYQTDIQPLIDAFDQVREILRNEPIGLPKIVAVGDQSSGKSSVLESITGISLPRGENTVTRCPFVIQMRSTKNNEEEKAEIWIDGSENKDMVTISDLSNAIVQKQKELIESIEKVEISETPIYLKVFMKNAPELSLYDLPGITYKNNTLTEKVRSMIRKFTQGSETLILLVLPANTDLTTSEALALCRTHTDFQDRIVPVITKIDLALNDKRLYDKIMNNELDLKYPPAVVRNRTTEELDSNENRQSIIEKEIELFKTHEVLKELPESSKGTKALVNTLINFQKERLINSKPQIIRQIYDNLNAVKEELKKLPESAETITDKVHRFKECMAILKIELDLLFNNIEPSMIPNVKSSVDLQFISFIKNFNDQSPKFLSAEYGNKIDEYIKYSSGLRLPNFYESRIFDKIISNEIKKIPSSMFYVSNDIAEILLKELLVISNKSFENYPKLVAELKYEIIHSIESKKDIVSEIVKTYMDMQEQIVITKDNYYIDIRDKTRQHIISFRESQNKKKMNINPGSSDQSIIKASLEKAYAQTFNESTEICINDITLLRSELDNEYFWNAPIQNTNSVVDLQISCFVYWVIFQKRFCDYFITVLIHHFIKFYETKFSDEIETKYSPVLNEKAKNLIEEKPEFRRKRIHLQNRSEALSKALQILRQVDF